MVLLETKPNTKNELNTASKESIANGMFLCLFFSVLFFAAVIMFANAQQKSSLKASIMAEIEVTGDISIEYLGKEEAGGYRHFYFVKGDGYEYIVRVYQDQITVKDAFNISEHPEIVDIFKEQYNIRASS